MAIRPKEPVPPEAEYEIWDGAECVARRTRDQLAPNVANIEVGTSIATSDTMFIVRVK
jgi:hypothetical protein